MIFTNQSKPKKPLKNHIEHDSNIDINKQTSSFDDYL